jgi:maleylacetate reductase
MIAVPTTLSAAEFNAYAGISDLRHGIKESFGHRLIVPRVIVLDPAATLATPMDLMLSTGLKAVDHAVERLCSQQAHPFVLGTATEALRLLRGHCRRTRSIRRTWRRGSTCSSACGCRSAPAPRAWASARATASATCWVRPATCRTATRRA